MTMNEVVSNIKVEDYGELYYTVRGLCVRAVGKVRYISSDGDIVFSHNDYGRKILIHPEDIVGFTPLDMLPYPETHRGKKIFWGGGEWTDEDGNYVDLKRN